MIYIYIIMNNIVTELVKYSFDKKLTHVPSALSMLTYIEALFQNKIVVPYRDKIVLGKPFGSQAYYLIWKKLGYLENIENLSVGVKHNEIDFVDYSEETMGNALGVGSGIAIANPTHKVWVNITDATLQMGSTLEAIQYIGHNSVNNIFVTVDYNNYQVTGKTSDVLDTTAVISFMKNNGWNVITVNGHDINDIKNAFVMQKRQGKNKPNVIVFVTVKGYGVNYMQNDPVQWHYKPIEQL